MFSLIRELGVRSTLRELPALLVALFVAETFYKFGSFTLEFVALVATWTAFSFILSRLK